GAAERGGEDGRGGRGQREDSQGDALHPPATPLVGSRPIVGPIVVARHVRPRAGPYRAIWVGRPTCRTGRRWRGENGTPRMEESPHFIRRHDMAVIVWQKNVDGATREAARAGTP